MTDKTPAMPEHTIGKHDHPEPHTMCWSELELAAIKRYAESYALAALQSQPAAEVSDAKWDGAEEWMPLAWELCAEEHGEEACNELIWTGGPIPEPWGDRWLQYEDEAKRLIALVRKHVPALRPQAVPMTAASRDVLAERQRQITAEGWTPEHDDAHGTGELAKAAASYAWGSAYPNILGSGNPPDSWPWADEWWKPAGHRRNLIKAGALILAEIERLDRASGITAQGAQGGEG